jgi:hypothetical protein
VAAWSWNLHVRHYREDTYPGWLLEATFGQMIWQNNIDRPVHEIAADLGQALGPQDRFVVLIDGAIPLYYFRDPRYLSQSPSFDPGTVRERGCLRWRSRPDATLVRAAVSSTAESFCPELVERVIRYPDSRLQVTVLARAP